MNSQLSLPVATTQTQPISKLLEAKKVLLLQGPIGPFFKNFAAWLERQQIIVHKVNFNGGDWFNSRGITPHNFAQPMSGFYPWLKQLVETEQFDAMVCFGDCRPQHVIAKQICITMGLDFFVFEEGYIRPDYITFEYFGVNGFSIWNNKAIQMQPVKLEEPIDCHQHFYLIVRFACMYYLAMVFGYLRFRHYKHHRGFSILQETGSWLRSAYRKIINSDRDKQRMQFIQDHLADQYFLCTLQVCTDFQIKAHSDYKDIRDFIAEVVESFAKHANPKDHLVFKHHPMDRGYRDYTQLINQLGERYGVSNRLHYVCDVHLPTLIEHSKGMITINSTTGLQSLYRHKPVQVLGRAVYHHPGVTSQLSMDEFWTQYADVDMSRYPLLKANLIKYTQLNGSFYGNMPWMSSQ